MADEGKLSEEAKEEKKELLKKDIVKKYSAYGINYLGGVIGNYFHLALKGPIAKFSGKTLENTLGIKSSIGNPVGAIMFGSLDIARNAFPKIKGSWPVIIAESVGEIYYSFSAAADLFGWLNGNWGSLVQLPFDAAMVYALRKSRKEDLSIKKSLNEE
jgi:hypothetical protein